VLQLVVTDQLFVDKQAVERIDSACKDFELVEMSDLALKFINVHRGPSEKGT
jgi:hypothetical protein